VTRRVSGRHLGQHFLSDPGLLRRIVDALEPAPGDTVLEIGPGRGSLTAQLAPRVARVIAIEKDRSLADQCGMWNAECGIRNVEIVVADALKLDWHGFMPHSALRTPHFKVIGNIPYNITTPLIEKALTPPLPARIVFLVQREVAERLAAAPGGKTYGALSVGVQAVCRVELLFRVPAGAFRPVPKVDSAVLRLIPLAEPLVAPAETAAFRRFVTACFSRRRKQLRNVLAAVCDQEGGTVSAELAAMGLDPAARPETLAPSEFVRLLRWSGRL
jgi:16S rRNA (adenine1518-N6/adenine1519-N6)-dimethyltransferase